MTRGKDIFWAVLAAGLPLVGTLGFGYLERYFKDIWVRTYDARLYFFANIVLFLILGILLAVMAVRFCSNPRETSRLPLLGLAVGWLMSVFIMFCLYFLFLEAEEAGYLHISGRMVVLKMFFM